jgi:CobQ/CobB/MinD/ParA nucleotide binding domain
MKVVSFHSYKGGRGRTTAIASLANLCARLGKHVVLLDADVTAPWLHTRYGVGSSALYSRGWLRGLLDELALRTSSGIFDCDLNEYWLEVGKHSGKDSLVGPGSIRLLAPGNPYTAEYWQWVADEFPRYLGLRENRHILDSWRDLRQLIASSDPTPDVMFVDAPAGYHQASALVATSIAHTAIVFAGADGADTEWTRELVEMINRERYELPDSTDRDLRTVAVRARYPEFFSPMRDPAIGLGDFEERLYPVGFDDFVTLDSDPRLESEAPEPPIPLAGPIFETPLVRRYSQLLAAALPEEWSSDMATLESLPPGTLVPGESPSFFWLQDRGILTNPTDEQRNVAFRVETFCGLLDDLHRELMPSTEEASQVDHAAKGVPKNKKGTQANQEARGALEKAGAGPGVKFGKSLGELLDASLTDRERLSRWCEFDSRVGFGHLTLANVKEEKSGLVLGGQIDVGGNFLAATRRRKDPDLCPLLSGYIEGVIGELLACHDVKVKHPGKSCMRLTKELPACGFQFTLAR